MNQAMIDIIAVAQSAVDGATRTDSEPPGPALRCASDGDRGHPLYLAVAHAGHDTLAFARPHVPSGALMADSSGLFRSDVSGPLHGARWFGSRAARGAGSDGAVGATCASGSVAGTAPIHDRTFPPRAATC